MSTCCTPTRIPHIVTFAYRTTTRRVCAQLCQIVAVKGGGERREKARTRTIVARHTHDTRPTGHSGAFQHLLRHTADGTSCVRDVRGTNLCARACVRDRRSPASCHCHCAITRLMITSQHSLAIRTTTTNNNKERLLHVRNARCASTHGRRQQAVDVDHGRVEVRVERKLMTRSDNNNTDACTTHVPGVRRSRSARAHLCTVTTRTHRVRTRPTNHEHTPHAHTRHNTIRRVRPKVDHLRQANRRAQPTLPIDVATRCLHHANNRRSLTDASLDRATVAASA
jgi:hypothetical protein